MEYNNTKFIANKSLLNNRHLYNLSKIKNKNSEIVHNSKHFNIIKNKKNQEKIKLNAVFYFLIYIPTIVFPSMNCRDVINNFPINLFLYKYMAIFNYVLTEFFFIYLAAWLISYQLLCVANYFGNCFRRHANLANLTEVFYTIASFAFYVIDDRIRWSFLCPVISSFTYTIVLGFCIFYIYFGIKYKFPYETRFCEESIPEEPGKNGENF